MIELAPETMIGEYTNRMRPEQVEGHLAGPAAH